MDNNIINKILASDGKLSFEEIKILTNRLNDLVELVKTSKTHNERNAYVREAISIQERAEEHDRALKEEANINKNNRFIVLDGGKE